MKQKKKVFCTETNKGTKLLEETIIPVKIKLYLGIARMSTLCKSKCGYWVFTAFKWTQMLMMESKSASIWLNYEFSKIIFLLFNFLQPKHIHCLITAEGSFFLLIKYMDTWSPACWPSADSGVHNKSLGILDCVALIVVSVHYCASWHVCKRTADLKRIKFMTLSTGGVSDQYYYSENH